MTVWVYLFYGAGGRQFSAGMEDKLAPLLRAIPGVEVPPTRPYETWFIGAAFARETPTTDKIVLAGHSLGAAYATHVAAGIADQGGGGRYVDLLVGYDCTLWSRLPIGSNVRRVIEFKGHTWVNPFGMRLLRPPAGIPYETYSRADAHVKFDDDLVLHQRFATAVRRLVP